MTGLCGHPNPKYQMNCQHGCHVWLAHVFPIIVIAEPDSRGPARRETDQKPEPAALVVVVADQPKYWIRFQEPLAMITNDLRYLKFLSVITTVG